MIIYNMRIPTVTPTATATPNLANIFPGTVKSFLLLELDFEGQGTSSGAAEFGIYRTTTAAATPGTTLTPVPIEQLATLPAFTGAAAVSYTTVPGLGTLVHSFGLNANGQRYFWRANPNLNNAIVVSGNTALTAGLSLILVAGSLNPISGRMQLAEL